MADKIMKELWEIKDEIAREHGYDLNALARYLRSRVSGDRKIVNLGAVRKKSEQTTESQVS